MGRDVIPWPVPATTHSLWHAVATALLEQGRRCEDQGDFAAALAAYARANAELDTVAERMDEARRLRGLVWMNRGNALQKRAGQIGGTVPESAHEIDSAIAAYDEAIAVFRTLRVESVPQYRNHLGAAWLNRGHACIARQDWRAAAESLEQAIAQLQTLSRDADPSFRLNLAGAWTNLAHVMLNHSEQSGDDVGPGLARARTAAQAALDELSGVELTHVAFAEMSLRARRACAMILGAQIVAAEAARCTAL
jgi:tetratricopeptide (TPR) repeat protein